jgi:hypothetical protein
VSSVCSFWPRVLPIEEVAGQKLKGPDWRNHHPKQVNFPQFPRRRHAKPPIGRLRALKALKAHNSPRPTDRPMLPHDAERQGTFLLGELRAGSVKNGGRTNSATWSPVTVKPLAAKSRRNNRRSSPDGRHTGPPLGRATAFLSWRPDDPRATRVPDESYLTPLVGSHEPCSLRTYTI